MKKKGMELQINFIVTLIIIIVIFTSSLALMFELFLKADWMQKQVMIELEARMDELFSQGEKVAIPSPVKNLEIGKYGFMGVGILNYGSQTASNKFMIHVSCDSAFDEEDNPFTEFPACSSGGTDWNGCFITLPRDSDITIDNNKKEKMFIKIAAKTNEIPSGKYNFKAYVCRDDALVGDCDGNPRTELYDDSIKTMTMIVS